MNKCMEMAGRQRLCTFTFSCEPPVRGGCDSWANMSLACEQLTVNETFLGILITSSSSDSASASSSSWLGVAPIALSGHGALFQVRLEVIGSHKTRLEPDEGRNTHYSLSRTADMAPAIHAPHALNLRTANLAHVRGHPFDRWRDFHRKFRVPRWQNVELHFQTALTFCTNTMPFANCTLLHTTDRSWSARQVPIYAAHTLESIVDSALQEMQAGRAPCFAPKRERERDRERTASIVEMSKSIGCTEYSPPLTY